MLCTCAYVIHTSRASQTHVSITHKKWRHRAGRNKIKTKAFACSPRTIWISKQHYHPVRISTKTHTHSTQQHITIMRLHTTPARHTQSIAWKTWRNQIRALSFDSRILLSCVQLRSRYGFGFDMVVRCAVRALRVCVFFGLWQSVTSAARRTHN